VTSTRGISEPRSVDLLPPTLQTIPEAIGRNIAIARARTRSRTMAVVKADGYGHGAITVAQAAIAAGAEWLGTTDLAEA
jgi:alanine racemase